MRSLLVANRGEVAVRIVRAAADSGIRSVAVYSEDEARSPHVERADAARPLAGRGPSAYLDAGALVAAARAGGCDALHPGYGFLSESAGLARACEGAGITFVGPRPETLEILGDKVEALAVARRAGVAVLGSSGPARSQEEASAFVAGLGGGPAVIKAVAGGGGRGMRVVRPGDDVGAAWRLCRAEAEAAFGRPDVYLERYVEEARHVEVQVAGAMTGELVVLGDRDCSIQRGHQKLVELAPAPGLDPGVREALAAAALEMARHSGCTSLVTFEFLVGLGAEAGSWWFIEANPRLQVEHTVTEEVTGLDLVRAQLALAAGASLAGAGLPTGPEPPPARGSAVQLRVNAEVLRPDGTVLPSSGTVTAFDPPGGPGVRIDTALVTGAEVSHRFDSLVAKLVVHVEWADVALLAARAARALDELRVEGVATNRALLAGLVRHPEFRAGRVRLGFLDEHLGALLGGAAPTGEPTVHPGAAGGDGAPNGVPAPLAGTVVAVEVDRGREVASGTPLAVIEAMKMHHVVAAPEAGTVTAVLVGPGDPVAAGQEMILLDPGAAPGAVGPSDEEADPGRVRADLAEVIERHDALGDHRRPEAVGRRRRTGQRTARENVADLCDPGTFVEYGSLAIAAQRRRRPVEELIERTPADGLVAGMATVNGDRFGEEAARCLVLAYDYTVLAGTQGLQNHRKKDRLFELAHRWHLPVVIFAEGGGGRPGDTDGTGVSGLDTMAFHLFGRLSGRVPLVGIASGRCFAGNAALLGCCDVVIATAGSNIGMGGPAMVEGGGLGVFRPEDIGPVEDQVRNGVVDVLVADEAEAAAAARRYLSYFQGPLQSWECPDQRLLRGVVPEDRLRVYDVRRVVEGMVDTDSVMELRGGFAPGMVTALARVEGRPVGVVANNPLHLAGAIDADAADKAARFLQLCDAFGLPVLFLCDTPGIMVGPDAERRALVRHAARLFVVGASLTVPFFTIVLRKGYGLGAQAMAGGSFKAPAFCVAWPTGEVGGMGLEGAVRLGYRRELDAVEDPEERRVLYEQMVARMYEHGRALNAATHFEIDDVIDPADSRSWISRVLTATAPGRPAGPGRRPCIDTW